MPMGPFDSESTSRPAGSQTARVRAARVLVISAVPARVEALTRALKRNTEAPRGAKHDFHCGAAESSAHALEQILPERGSGRGARFDAVVLDCARCDAQALRFVRELTDLEVASVIVCAQVSFDEAVQAMRAGAGDILSGATRLKELPARVSAAVAQARGGVSRFATRADGLLNADAVASQAQRLAAGHAVRPDHLVAGSLGKAKKIRDAGPLYARSSAELGAQFGALIRNELDVETLLRHALEFVLAHAGPTNAAVFLPAASGDFSLGAYVNFSCPKETAEVLLDHLANVAAPRLEGAPGILNITTDAEMEQHVGQGTDWLAGHDALAFSCRHEEESLAVFMLFRERTQPFSAEMRAFAAELSTRFGAQLAKVVRIHHRHLPRDKWGKLGEPRGGNDDDLTA